MIFTLGALAILAVTWNWETINVYQRILLVFCALIFTVVQPLMLLTGRRSSRPGPSVFPRPLNLTLGDEKDRRGKGRDDRRAFWNQVWKVVRIKSMYIIKTGPVHGYLIPNRPIEGRSRSWWRYLKRICRNQTERTEIMIATSWAGGYVCPGKTPGRGGEGRGTYSA